MIPDQMKQMMLAQALQQQSFQPSQAPQSSDPGAGVSPMQGLATGMQGYTNGMMMKNRMDMMKGLMGTQQGNPFQGNGPLQSYGN